MKILFILPEYYPHSGGGISTYYLHYIQALQPYCAQIKVLVGSGYTQAKDNFEYEGVIIEYLKPELYQEFLNKFTQYELLPEFQKNIAAAWAMWQQAGGGHGYDIIECTDFGLGFIPWVINHNKTLITRLHGSMGQVALHDDSLPGNLANVFIQQAELLLLPLCDVLISHSKTNRLFWNNVLKTEVVYINPVYNKVTEPLPLSQRDSNGLVTARIQKWKGPFELCEACALMAKPELIKWAGRDMLFNKQQSTDDYLSSTFPSIWGKSVIPLAPLPHQQIQALQRKAKYGIVASTWDMFNFTGVEFMSAGTPVICSTGAGVAGLIENGKNGFKFKAGDAEALAECITKLNQLTGDEYDKMANAAFETIKTELNADKLIPVNLGLYQSVIQSFKPASSNHYLNTLYKPSDFQYDLSDVLDKQPLKKLTKYYANRLQLKLSGKK